MHFRRLLLGRLERGGERDLRNVRGCSRNYDGFESLLVYEVQPRPSSRWNRLSGQIQ